MDKEAERAVGGTAGAADRVAELLHRAQGVEKGLVPVEGRGKKGWYPGGRRGDKGEGEGRRGRLIPEGEGVVKLRGGGRRRAQYQEMHLLHMMLPNRNDTAW